MIGDEGSTEHAPVVVVHVEETISPALVGRDGVAYQSPPMPRAEALALVRLLIGRDGRADEDSCWRCPIAGGRRTVTLEPVPSAPGS
jgi:hypothetical protein